jgi:hypothetical protein
LNTYINEEDYTKAKTPAEKIAGVITEGFYHRD